MAHCGKQQCKTSCAYIRCASPTPVHTFHTEVVLCYGGFCDEAIRLECNVANGPRHRQTPLKPRYSVPARPSAYERYIMWLFDKRS